MPLCSVYFWTLVGSRMCHKLKENYFLVILSQKQGWFDSNNPFEFAIKAQAQLEQVEIGIGEKFGQIFTMLSQCNSAFTFAFITSWKLSFVMLCIAPFITVDILILVNVHRIGVIMGRKAWEKAGGLVEEMLYNIKTVASFANFEFETKRFNKKEELVYHLDLGTVYWLALCIGFLILFLNCSFVIAIVYGRALVGKNINSNKGRDFTGADAMTAAFCTITQNTATPHICNNIKYNTYWSPNNTDMIRDFVNS